MLARHAHPGLAAIMLQHRLEMHAHRGVLLGERRIGQALAGAQVMDRLVEEPRPAIGAAADHDAVGARLLQRPVDVVERLDVAIGDHRQPGCRLDLADEAPVGIGDSLQQQRMKKLSLERAGRVLVDASRGVVEGSEPDANLGDRRHDLLHLDRLRRLIRCGAEIDAPSVEEAAGRGPGRFGGDERPVDQGNVGVA